MKEIKYLKHTHDSGVGRVRLLPDREAVILVTLGYAAYYQGKRRKTVSKKDTGNG
ncbi:hypothetical protein [Serratia sp. M24T3]|uniref:hypothetical protein n=1 Tax=Serratia sp. M24T3 TaxID=932213 RepID=UPI000312A9C6|nr:hypothetical protein [Serratia sp. M24T3]